MSRSVIPLMQTITSTTRKMEGVATVAAFENPPSSTSLREFYVVQRCWYSGPRQDVAPVDYLRLLETREDAQEAAFHSAMAWSGLPSHMLATIPVRNHQEGQVETTTAYAALDCLFWVRRVWGSVVVASSSSSSSSSPSSFNHHSQLHHHHQQYQHYNHGAYEENHCEQNHHHHASARRHYDHHHHHHHPETTTAITAAFAVLTEGVIGGTGNRNSRRGVEVSKGRIFLATMQNPLEARAAALHVARQLQDDITQRMAAPLLLSAHHHQPNIQVVAIPIGKPAEYATKRFAQEWYHPMMSSSMSSSSSTTATNMAATNSSAAKPVWKRSWSDQDLVSLTDSTQQDNNCASWLDSTPTTKNTSMDCRSMSLSSSSSYAYAHLSKRRRRCGGDGGVGAPYSFYSKVASPGSDDEVVDMTVCWS